MLMENTLRLKDPEKLNYIFDLKGSLVDRKVKGVTKASTTLKDVNFLMAAKENKHFTAYRSKDKRLLRSTLSKDVEFLRSQGLMDYSLLLGIETLDERLSMKIHRISAARVSVINRIRPPLMNAEQFRHSTNLSESFDVLQDEGLE